MNPSKEKIIIVNATALVTGGALSILRQFLNHIKNDEIYYIFIHPSLSLNAKTNNIHFIKINIVSGVRRILWDSWGLKKWLKQRGIIAHTVISLQNTSIAYDRSVSKFIYLHQGLPLHHTSWSFLKRRERKFAFYKYIYPLFIFMHIDKKTRFIVQTTWMKKRLCERFRQNEKNVHVIKPDIVRTDYTNIQAIDLPYQFTLFYPATSALFKNHKEIIYALYEMQHKKIDITKIGLYLTIREEEDSELSDLISTFNLKNNVHFLGGISYAEVLSYYKSCTTVVFPSYIESFGLPLLEAAALGKPLVVINEDYAQEVIGNYPGVLFASKDCPAEWMNAIVQSFSAKDIKPYQPQYNTSWEDFFQLIVN